LEQRLRARYEDGLRDGERLLREQLLQQRADVLQLRQGALQALQDCLPGVRVACEAALVELALETARKLVAGLPISADLVEAAVREALDAAQQAHEITVLVHPDDLELLRRVDSPVLDGNAGGKQIQFIPSAEVSRGGCLARTRFGAIDARRESKFTQLKQALEA
jgi:flagellar assembly protein FliH